MTDTLTQSSPDAVIPQVVPPDHVLIKVDGKQLVVKKGTNLIEAAKLAGVEVPHYCYHPDLSIAGNCRMCQVSVAGRPKLEIACNTTVADGMDVSTHMTSKDVKDAQASVLEFILVNHPLDCTVCDQAGHCKLQDYHFQYNARPSRVTTEKEHKVKAKSLGPTVMLDGERCIMCTRCVRFCDEVTETSELGMMNRGDHSVISISPGRELDNPFSGNVVDLCPVGALTHKEWRFNTRVWFTKKSDTICAGCSTGCNITVHTRDNQVVLVKGRRNEAVNKEWLCDEGRYSLPEFMPQNRSLTCSVNGIDSDLQTAIFKSKKLISKGKIAVILSGDTLLEDLHELSKYKDKISEITMVDPYIKRSELEKILVKEDRAGNIHGAKFLNLLTESSNLSSCDIVIAIGDKALIEALRVSTPEKIISLQVKDSRLNGISFPIRSYIERSGTMINFQNRIQYLDSIGEWPSEVLSTWKVLRAVFTEVDYSKLKGISDRERTLELLASGILQNSTTIKEIKNGGIVI